MRVSSCYDDELCDSLVTDRAAGAADDDDGPADTNGQTEKQQRAANQNRLDGASIDRWARAILLAIDRLLFVGAVSRARTTMATANETKSAARPTT